MKLNISIITKILSLSFITALLSACIGSGVTHTKENYLFDIAMPNISTCPDNAITVTPLATTIADQFRTKQFTYRINQFQYKTAFYQGFITPPQNQMSHILTSWFQGIHFTSTKTSSKFKYTLSSHINTIYGNYQNKDAPTGEISITFSMIQNPGNQLVFHKTYTQSSLLTQKSSLALMQAWNSDIEIILEQLTNDLSSTFGGQHNIISTGAISSSGSINDTEFTVIPMASDNHPSDKNIQQSTQTYTSSSDIKTMSDSQKEQNAKNNKTGSNKTDTKLDDANKDTETPQFLKLDS